MSLLRNGNWAGGTRIQETYDYTKRLQPVLLRLGTAADNDAISCLVFDCYSAAAPGSCAVPTPGTFGNNGNVMGYYYQDSVNPNPLQHKAAYTYDSLNRLATATVTPVSPGTLNYNFTYSYDRYGNPTCSPGGSGCVSVTYEAPGGVTNNRINQVGSGTVIEDAAGNVIQDSSDVPAKYYAWDAEGKLKWVSSTPGSGDCPTDAIACYTYNALGQLAELNWKSYNRIRPFVYTPAGQELAQYNVTGQFWEDQYISVAGRHIAKYYGCCDTEFLHPNVIGSTTMVTNQFGNTTRDEVFYPYGQLQSAIGSNWDTRFAAFQQREFASGLDPTNSRFYHSRIFRWMSPDDFGGGAVAAYGPPDPTPPGALPYADILNPQSLNKYQYALNNPFRYNDPMGHSSTPILSEALELLKQAADPAAVQKALDGIARATAAAEGAGTAVTSAVAIPITAVVGAGALALSYSMVTQAEADLKMQEFGAANDVRMRDGGGSKSDDKVETPKTHPKKFDPVRGKPGKIHRETRHVFEKDPSKHGGPHYEEYKTKRDYEKGKRWRRVSEDGVPGKVYNE